MTRKSIWSYIIAAVITLSQPTVTLASAPEATLTGLAVTADVIVVAKVERVSADAGAGRLAEARVLAVWKGKPDPVVTFRASKSWECDVSDAQDGETVVLFLVKKPKTTVMSITYWGQGRIPIREEGGKALVFLGMQEDCIKVVADGAVKKLQLQPSIGTIGVRELEKRVRDILREKRATCNPISNVA
jgi:hypothetical protein